MKIHNKQLLLIVCCLFVVKSFSQHKKLGLEANLPVLLGQNFLADNYTGIFDIGANYSFKEFNSVKIGGSLHASFLKNNNNSRFNSFDIRVYAIQPKVYADFNIESIPNLHFKTGLGYSLFIFDLIPNENTPQFNPNMDTVENENGVALSLGTVYNFNDSFYATFQYDFIKLFTEEGVPSNAYNTNLNMLKIGVGIRI